MTDNRWASFSEFELREIAAALDRTDSEGRALDWATWQALDVEVDAEFARRGIPRYPPTEEPSE